MEGRLAGLPALRLSASWETDPRRRNLTSLSIGGEACGGVLRPRSVTVSTWRATDGTHSKRTHVFDMRIERAHRPRGVLAIPGGAAFTLTSPSSTTTSPTRSRLDEPFHH